MSSPHRIVVHGHGGPDALSYEAFTPGEPGPGEVRVAIEAVGVNYIDTYHRTGLYPIALPGGLGVEAAGTIEAVGPDVANWSPGDRVALLIETRGAYATQIVVRADLLFALPDSVSAEVAAAALLKGITAWMLVERCGKVAPGQIALVHAAAGGGGSLLVPWLKHAGAIVIAHAGTPEKAESARQNGADHALSVAFDALAGAVREITNGHGADVIYDGVGAASWSASLAAIARRGLLVTYGNASGPVPPLSPLELLRAGSIFLTRPSMFHYVDTPESRAEAGRRLFAMLGQGAINADIGQRFALADAADAHRALESRATRGSTILIP